MKNYYEDTTHISSSMIRTYLKSPAYYKAMYVDKVIDKKETPAMTFGSAVDCFLTEGENVFHQHYGYKVLYKDDPEMFKQNKVSGKVILTKETYDKVVFISSKIRDTEAFQWLIKNKSDMQAILKGEYFGVKVKGKLDFLTIIGKTAYIDDLKTTSNIHPKKYYYHCLDFGYFIQAAMYRLLVAQNYPVDTIINRHLVVSKDTDWPEIKTFVINDNLIDGAMDEIDYAINGIINKRFDDPPCNWENALSLGKDQEEIIEL